jgi:triosephosphate isomerase
MSHLYIANWKMNLHYKDIQEFISTNRERLYLMASRPNIIFGIAPTAVALPLFEREFFGSKIVMVGQNCSQYSQGAYTGEISARSLREAGCTFCLVGHSERRQLYGETTPIIIEKIKRIIEQKMNPIICIGESLQERKEGLVDAILTDQLTKIVTMMIAQNRRELFISYEPQWSIGSGKTPSLVELEHAAMIIRKIVFSQDRYLHLKILYGGSIKSENIRSIRKIDLYSGFLIGSASLDMQTLEKIVI